MDKYVDNILPRKKAELIKKLEAISNIEASKAPEVMDDDLVMECVYYLLELKGENIPSQEEIRKRIDAIPFVDEPDDLENGKITDIRDKKNKNRKINKRLLYLVACIMALLAASSVASVAFEKDIVHIIADWFGGILNIPASEEYTVNGESINVSDYQRSYRTIKEAIKSEDVDLLYPSKLPENVAVNEIYCYKSNGVDTIAYSLNSEDYSLEVWLNQNIDVLVKNDESYTKEINGLKCFVYDMSDVSCIQAVFEYEKNVYIIHTKTEKEMINIIENMEELHND